MDNVVPEIDLNRVQRFWHMSQIYDGPSKPGRIVPNVDDAVLDWTSGLWRVVAVDTFKTNLSYMVRVNMATLGGGVDDNDKAIVTGPGINANSFRVYVNTAVVPHTLSVDSRVIWNGSANSYIKVFRGTDTSAATGNVISAVLNSTGNISSENIPLETVVIPNGTNVTQKTAKTAFCSDTVTDGEICTVVTYTSAGQVTSIDKFVIKTTNYVRSINQAAKYVTNIELLSPFLSKTDKRLIECPINMVTQSLQFTGKVTYNDGSSNIYPIDGTRFTLAGMTTFIASQIGQMIDIQLVYNLSASELSFEATANLPDRRIVEPYRLRTMDVDTYYSVKLFAVPVWGSDNKYTMKYYLYNLERADIIDVSALVEYGATSPTFVGNKYNSAQSMIIVLNMQKLGPTYAYFRHVQPVTVNLIKPGTTVAAAVYYTIAYSESTTYGDNVRALFTSDEQNAGKLKLNISCGNTDPASWITNVYRNLEPLYYSVNEPRAPAPTHARIIIGSFQREVSINDITNDIRNINVGIAQGAVVRVELFARDAEGDKQLAVAPMVASSMA